MTCSAYIVNLATNAMSKWIDVAFVRTWKLNGKMYGIAADGVYLIEGIADTQCTIEIAPNDFESDKMKRMHYAILNGKGESSVTPVYDGIDGTPQLTQFTDNMRVKFGRGAKGRNLGVKIASVAPDFSLESISLYPDELSRRV